MISNKTVKIFTITIIGVLGFSITASAANSSVPDWVKNNAKWWSEGSITEADYIKSLEYLITQGIIQIPIPITEVTAAQTPLSDDERAQSFVVRFSDGLIEKPITVTSFMKYESTSSKDKEIGIFFPIYQFDDKPEFLLESLPSTDKKEFYIGVNNWMTEKTAISPFDVDIEIISGDGRIIQTWEYRKCELTGYGTYLQDVINFYQFTNKEQPEIRERATFSCAGIELIVP